MSKNMKGFSFKILMAIALLATVVSCTHTTEQKESVNEMAVKVKVVRVQKKKLQSIVRSTGMLASKSESKLSFKTGGIISKILVDEGESVANGQVLAQLNLSEIQAQVNQAFKGLEKAQRDFDMTQRLLNDSLITKELFQNAGTALDVAKNTVQIAEFNLRYSTIKAPANGKILKRLNEAGEMIGPGYPVFLFSSRDINWVMRTNITDKDIVNIEIGDSAQIFFDAFPNDTLIAFISEIASMSDPYTGTYEVELRLKETAKRLVTGLIGKVELYRADFEEYYVVPLDAMVEAENDMIKLYRTKGDSVEKLRLKAEKKIGGLLYIKSGLDTSMTVVTNGAGYCDEDKKIEIVE